MIKSGRFGSKSVMKVIYLIVIISSIGICFLGLQSNANKERQRKVEYAKTTIKNETVKIQRLNKQILQFYQNDQEEFLVEPVDMEKLKEMEREILSLKTEAKDFDLKSNDFSVDTVEVTQGKKEMTTKIKNLKNKKEIQEQITALLVHAPSDWTAQTIDIIINEQASVTAISKLRSKIADSENEWNNAIIAFLTEMDTQVKYYSDLKQEITAMSKDGVLSDSVTMDNFILIFNQLDQIKNETLKKELVDKMDVIDNLLEKQAMGEVIVNQEEILPSEEPLG